MAETQSKLGLATAKGAVKPASGVGRLTTPASGAPAKAVPGSGPKLPVAEPLAAAPRLESVDLLEKIAAADMTSPSIVMPRDASPRQSAIYHRREKSSPVIWWVIAAGGLLTLLLVGLLIAIF